MRGSSVSTALVSVGIADWGSLVFRVTWATGAMLGVDDLSLSSRSFSLTKVRKLGSSLKSITPGNWASPERSAEFSPS